MPHITLRLLWYSLLGILFFQQFFVSAQEIASSFPPQPGKTSLQSRSLGVVLAELERKFAVHFSFDSELIQEKVISPDITLSNNLEEALKQLLAPHRLQYRKVADKYYAIFPESSRKEPKEVGKTTEKTSSQGVNNDLSIPQTTSQGVSPPVQVSGRVTDGINAQGLPGVTVVLKGTSTGTATDGNGNYTLTVPDGNGTLVFSFIGYTTQEVAIRNQSTINVSILPDTKSLDEVVVVGYGTQRKKDITGAVASVPVERLRDQPIPNVEQAIKGQVAGVQVTQNSGSPSGGVNIKIRGTSSITAGNEPLFVIDGFPVTAGDRGQGNVANGNPLNNINPNDIESIDILKDASATAIYGSRGSNGVVIITTKSGKSGKARISLDAYTGIQTITKKIDVLNAEEMAELHIDSRNNGWLQSGGNPATPNEQRGRFTVSPFWFDPQQWQPTDYQDEIFPGGPSRIIT